MTLNCSFHASMAVLTFSGRKDWCGYVFSFFCGWRDGEM